MDKREAIERTQSLLRENFEETGMYNVIEVGDEISEYGEESRNRLLNLDRQRNMRLVDRDENEYLVMVNHDNYSENGNTDQDFFEALGDFMFANTGDDMVFVLPLYVLHERNGKKSFLREKEEDSNLYRLRDVEEEVMNFTGNVLTYFDLEEEELRNIEFSGKGHETYKWIVNNSSQSDCSVDGSRIEGFKNFFLVPRGTEAKIDNEESEEGYIRVPSTYALPVPTDNFVNSLIEQKRGLENGAPSENIEKIVKKDLSELKETLGYDPRIGSVPYEEDIRDLVPDADTSISRV